LKTKKRQNKTINLGTYEANKNNIIRIPTINKISNASNVNNISNIEDEGINNQSKMLLHRRLGHFYQDNINKYRNIHNFKPVKYFDC